MVTRRDGLCVFVVWAAGCRFYWKKRESFNRSSRSRPQDIIVCMCVCVCRNAILFKNLPSVFLRCFSCSDHLVFGEFDENCLRSLTFDWRIRDLIGLRKVFFIFILNLIWSYHILSCLYWIAKSGRYLQNGANFEYEFTKPIAGFQLFYCIIF